MSTTQEIIELLRNHPRGMPPEAVARSLKQQKGHISSRLSKLKNYGLINAKKIGPRTIYTAKGDGADCLLDVEGASDSLISEQQDARIAQSSPLGDQQ